MFMHPSRFVRWFVLGTLFILLMATCSALTGCVALDDENIAAGAISGKISRWHDDEKSVTCWTFKNGYAGGLSCIPDHMLVGY